MIVCVCPQKLLELLCVKPSISDLSRCALRFAEIACVILEYTYTYNHAYMPIYLEPAPNTPMITQDYY